MALEERRAEKAGRRWMGAGFSDNAYLLLALCSLFWSGNHVLGRAIAGHVPPYGISTVRWLLTQGALQQG